MLPPAKWPRAAVTLYRTFGLGNARLRAEHELRRAAGRFRTAPRHEAARHAPPATHVVSGERLAQATDRARALARADRVAGGQYQAYRWDWRALPRTPAEWQTHPHTGKARPADGPWWQVSHLDAGLGDIKDLWEPARFGWAYDLVRAYLITGDDGYAQAFHRTLASWVESSPPFRGAHWSCGQETSIRAAALLYAEANLASAPSSDADAMGRLADVLAASGERVADAIGYAVSQRNNHGLSEATGLILLGSRFSGAHPEADAWLERGHALLDRLIAQQFARDGWYIQHSFTYLRLALEQCVLAVRALASVGRELSDESTARLRAAIDLLLAVIDPRSGRVPNHGSNDGAFVLPITLADYDDFRPVLTAACATWAHALPADINADAEVLAWLGAEVEAGPATADGVTTGESGWAAARVGATHVFLRAGRYRSRPGHLDPLHVDVRIDGKPIVVDPGTYAYNAPPPWRNGLSGAGVHNGPVVDGREPGIRGPRFLWYEWPSAELVSARGEAGRAELIGRVPGSHERRVTVYRHGAVVRDRVLGRGQHDVRIAWLLHPDADEGALRVRGESRSVDAREGAVDGWYSPEYGRRIPSRAVVIERALTSEEPIVVEIGNAADEPAESLAATTSYGT